MTHKILLHSNIKIFLCALFTSLFISITAQTSFKGKVFNDTNKNGLMDIGEKGFKNVAVSDGLNVVVTDETGVFSLPGNPKTRFIFITTPAGFKTSKNHYIKIDKDISSYQFGLLPFVASGKKDTRFIHLADTESSEDNGWIKPIKDFAADNEASFIIHTGDICQEKGMTFHSKYVNKETMGLPVYYCVGNHDIIKGDYGEQFFENNFGPTYYSFDAGNTHYLVTPMLSYGDVSPSNTKEDVYRWMKNDLSFVDKSKNIVVFNHDLLTFGDEFIYGINDDEQLNLNKFNLKAWIYGHFHINYMKKHGNSGVVSVCASPPDKGGIDHSSSNFVVYEMEDKGIKKIFSRYNYLDKHISVVCPNGNQVVEESKNVLPVSVNFYSTASDAKTIECRIETEGKKAIWTKLNPQTDWNWTGAIKFDDKIRGKEVKIRVRALIANGDSISKIHKFIVPKGKGVKTEISTTNLKLAWVKNTGGNIWMTSPLCENGKVIVATMDEFSHQTNFILAYESENGNQIWKYKTDSSIKNTITIDDGKVIATDEEGVVYALDVETGILKWKKSLGQTYLPAYVGGNICRDGVLYTGFANYLSALSTKDGSLLWKNEEKNGGEGTTSTHSLAEDILIYGSNWNALFGYDIKTGKKVWQLKEHDIRYRSGTSVFANDTLFVIGGETINKVNHKNGAVYKSYNVKHNLQVASAPLITDEMIILGTADNGLMAFNRNNMQEIWTVKTRNALIYTSPYTKPPFSTTESTPIFIGDKICFGASDGFVYVVNSKDGKIVQEIELGSPILGKPCLVNNAVYVADFSGNIVKFYVN